MTDIDKILPFLKALANDPDEIRVITIYGKPCSKARPRLGRYGVYKDKKDSSNESKTKAALIKSIENPYLGNVAMACLFYRDTKQRIDTDNLLKHVCDSANGVVWIDDSQVTAITGVLEYDPINPRTIFACAPHVTSMSRGINSKRKCEKCENEIHIKGAWHKKRFCDACKHLHMFRPKKPKSCAICNSSFAPDKKHRKFCSNKCAGKNLSNIKTRKPTGRTKPFSYCQDCGKHLAHRRGGRCRKCYNNGRIK